MSSTTRTPFRGLIVEGGVAGLEAALALRELAGDRIAATLLSGVPEFVYRPLRVTEPFGGAVARHYPLDEIVRDAGLCTPAAGRRSTTTRCCWRRPQSCDPASSTR